MAITVDAASRSQRTAQRVWSDWARWALLAVWAAVVISAFVTGTSKSSFADLTAALQTGNTRAVAVTGDSFSQGHGYSTRELRWRQGGREHQASIVVVGGVPTSEVPSDAREGTSALVRGDLARTLRADQPGVRLTHLRDDPAVRQNFLGLQVPGWLGLSALITWLATLAVLTNAPRVWHATRWAWFWVLLVPFGPALFLVLAGPTPPLLRQPLTERRLTGGWAFLVQLFAGPASGGLT